jgi:hypothetical protein
VNTSTYCLVPVFLTPLVHGEDLKYLLVLELKVFYIQYRYRFLHVLLGQIRIRSRIWIIEKVVQRQNSSASGTFEMNIIETGKYLADI